MHALTCGRGECAQVWARDLLQRQVAHGDDAKLDDLRAQVIEAVCATAHKVALFQNFE